MKKIIGCILGSSLMFFQLLQAAVIATRLSNPESVSGQADGLFPGGDRENSYAWCMDILKQPDGEYLYVGSNRDLVYLFLVASLQAGNFPPDVTIDYLCESVFQGDITSATDLRGRIFRRKANDDNGEWELVYTSPLIPGTFFPRDLGYRGALTFIDSAGTDTALYIVTTALPVPGVPISTRVLKFPHNFGPGSQPKEVLRLASLPGQSNTLRPIAQYNGKLYVGTSTNEIYESALPPEQTPSPWPPDTATVGWRVVATDIDFLQAGEKYKYFCWEFQEYNGYLYVVLGSIEPDDHATHGFLLFRGRLEPAAKHANEAGWVWEEIVGDTGLYPPGMGISSHGVASLVVFNDYLYVGTFNDVLGPLITSGPAGIITSINPPRIYRFSRDHQVEMVIGDVNPDSPYLFLRSRIGNYGSGFFNRSLTQVFFPQPWNTFNYSMNQYIWWMEVYQGKLYCSTFDIRVFLKYLTDEALVVFGIDDAGVREQILRAIVLLSQANNNPAGFDVYVTADGTNWQPVTRDGFGDQFNYGGRVLKAADNSMYIGTANPFYGCQVWRLEEQVGSAGGGNCFIATAAFDTPLAGPVQVLRNFRDNLLLKFQAGKGFVAWYYRHSPLAARFISRYPLAKWLVRMCLYPVVAICWLWLKDYLGALLLVLSLGLMTKNLGWLNKKSGN
ncbi:MAG: hypothetical protein NC911_10640 [Candidatus Omnitrophica bacterium]|nr:hypothetical protein [Candidatus Omnitrophota bacterium]